MAVTRQANILGQQRIDVPVLRALESAICADFDLLAGRILGGKAALIVSGFKLIYSGVTASDQLQLAVADSVAVHYYASESGSIFVVPADRAVEKLNSTNARLTGTFAPGATNYIGVDFVRVADDSTADLTMFLDATSGQEVPKTVPLGRVVDYRIVVSTRDFASLQGVCPVAIVVTNAGNEVLSVTDARNLMFRLGTGGTHPNTLSAGAWPQGRKESTSLDAFAGGDKTISSFKGWIDAAMTRIWEIGGGEYWYSPTADRNVRLVHSGTPFTSTGEYFEYTGGNLHWKGLRVIVDNSTATFNEIKDQITSSAGLTDLADGDCLYVDLDRTVNRTGATALVAKRVPLSTLGSGSPPGSRIVFAWRYGSQVFTRDQGYPVNSSFKLATSSTAGTVRLTSDDPSTGSSGARVGVINADAFSDRQIVAGGLTRGDSSTMQMWDGQAGDLLIGTGNRDYNILLYNSRTQDATKVSGSQVYAAGARATLEVVNNASALAANNRLLKLSAYNNTTGLVETSLVVEATGAVGHRIAPLTPSTPSPSSSDPVRCKTFFRTNGLATPNTRDQSCIMWHDGSVLVIAEGPAY